MIDTHCHLHDQEFFSAEQAEKMLVSAHERGITDIIVIGTDPKDSLAARDFAETHDHVYWTYGCHPSEAGKESEKAFLESFRFSGCTPLILTPKKLSSDSLVAIGEVGLDYHYEPYDREAQIHLFEQYLQLALDLKLPVSFHIREAFDDFFAIIANFPQITGVVHSFSDSKKTLRKLLETTDFYIGVNGLATYSTLPTPPLERILLETDAPFLAPVPHRGETNQPAFVADIAEWLSGKLERTTSEIAEITTVNAHKLFDI